VNRSGNSSTMKAFVLFMPVLILYLIFIGGGFFRSFIESLGYLQFLGLTKLSLEYYKAVLNHKDFFIDLWFSIRIAFISSLTSTILGVIIAYCIAETKSGALKSAAVKAINTGLILPYLYSIFLAMTFFSQAGFVSRVLYQLKIISGTEDFPGLLYDPSGAGIMIAFVFKGIPFVALFTTNVMAHISGEFGDAARSLGAGKLRILRKVYLPLSSTVIVWCACILFAYYLGSFEVPYILGSLSPRALSSRLYSLYINPDIFKIPQTMALSILIFAIGIITTAAYAVLLKKLIGGRSR